MAKTVIGLFEDLDAAEAVVVELADQGVASEDIGIVAPDEAGDAGREREAGDRRAGDNRNVDLESAPGDETKSERAKEGAKKGAVTGGAIGGVAGLAAAVAGLSIPGVGPILAAGPIAAALAGAGVGAAAGGLIGALTKMGVPEHEAKRYAEGVSRGGVLVTVRADDRNAEALAIILADNGALDVERLAEDWRSAESDQTAMGMQEDRPERLERRASRVYAPIVDVTAEERIDLEEQQRGKAERRRAQAGRRYDGPERRQQAQI